MSEHGTGAEFTAPHDDEFTEVIQPKPVNKVDGNSIDSDWWSLAICKGTDPEIFFATDKATQALAKQVCAECVVIGECLDYAISNNEYEGTWGGATEQERRSIRKTQIGVPTRRRRRK